MLNKIDIIISLSNQGKTYFAAKRNKEFNRRTTG